MDLNVSNSKTIPLANVRKPAFHGHEVREWNLDEVLPTAASIVAAIIVVVRSRMPTAVAAVSRDFSDESLTSVVTPEGVWLELLGIVEAECILTVQ